MDWRDVATWFDRNGYVNLAAHGAGQVVFYGSDRAALEELKATTEARGEIREYTPRSAFSQDGKASGVRYRLTISGRLDLLRFHDQVEPFVVRKRVLLAELAKKIEGARPHRLPLTAPISAPGVDLTPEELQDIEAAKEELEELPEEPTVPASPLDERIRAAQARIAAYEAQRGSLRH